MHIPKKGDFFWLESFNHSETPSLDSIASDYFGRPYKGQQTGGCLPRGIQRYDMNTEEDCRVWMNDEEGKEMITGWLSKSQTDYLHEFEMQRDAPYISYVLAHLILNRQLPYGEYLINIDW